MEDENTSLAFWVREPGVGELRATALSALAPGQVRVRTLYTGISRGTESLVFNGRVPASQTHDMRCPHQEGDFPGPVKYGYMNVGQVEAGLGPAAEALVGRQVFCLYPHQDRYVVPVESVFALPPGLPPERGVLAANLETAVNAVWDGRPGPGDRVLVVGGGVVGLLVAWLCRHVPGADVVLVDPNPSRRAVATALGVSFTERAPVALDADLVFHASGSSAGLATALASVGLEGTVVELSWFGDQSVSVPLGEAFHSRRITLRSSQVGRISPSRSARWTPARRMDLTLRLLDDPALDALISGESRFEELPRVMPSLASGSGDALCHRIVYDTGTHAAGAGPS